MFYGLKSEVILFASIKIKVKNPAENFISDDSGVRAPNGTVKRSAGASSCCLDGVFGVAVSSATRLSVIPAIGLHWWTLSLIIFNMKTEKKNVCEFAGHARMTSCKNYFCCLKKP